MAIVGKGDIASAIQESDLDREEFTFFCSGVSISSELRESEYQREVDLLAGQDRGKRLIYFSSLSIFYSYTRYAQHKKEMEDFVRWWFPHYTIVRLGNIDWGTNPHTIINFLKNKIRNREPFEIQDTYRYICDKDEFLYWIGMIPPDRNCEMNIIGKRLTVKQIVEEYCYPWGKFDESRNLNSAILEGQCSYT